MSKIRYTLTPEHKDKENLWKVDIILHHHYERRVIPTNIYATTKDITPDKQLRGRILRETMDLCRLYRQRMEHLQLRDYELDIDTIKKLITANSEVDIDFIGFSVHWLEKNKDMKSLFNYKMALKSFKNFVGKDSFPCSMMSVQLLKEFEHSLFDRPCAADKYPRAIRHIFNEIREMYNDNDTSSLFVKRNLDHWKVDRPYFPARNQRALTVDEIRAIAAYPCPKRINSCITLARDAFLISFMTMGTNAVDLMNCVYDEDGNITYERAKVRDRRADNGRIVIKIHPCLEPLIEKYKAFKSPVIDGKVSKKSNKGEEQEKVFRFSRRFRHNYSFDNSLHKGFKKLGKLIGIPDLTFYAARHSMATIATNDLGINKYVVHEMLNHRLHLFRVTNRYLQQNFDEINNANFKLLDYVFGGREEEGIHNTFVDPNGDFGCSVFVDSLEEVEDSLVSLRYMVIPQDKLPDDKWRVVIRLTFMDESMDIPTSIIVGKDGLNNSYDITDGSILDRCETLKQKCEQKIKDIDLYEVSSIRELISKLND